MKLGGGGPQLLFFPTFLLGSQCLLGDLVLKSIYFVIIQLQVSTQRLEKILTDHCCSFTCCSVYPQEGPCNKPQITIIHLLKFDFLYNEADGLYYEGFYLAFIIYCLDIDMHLSCR